MDAPHYSIEAVSRRTGLSAHVIRIWEKRYRAVEPARTATNRRQYSAQDIERLTLLRDLTRSGQSIGYIAKLPSDQLRQLGALAEPATSRHRARRRTASSGTGSPAEFVDAALEAVKHLDAVALEAVLKRSEVALGAQGMLQHVAAPLAEKIGEHWRSGNITAAHEHFASALLRTQLGLAARGFAGGTQTPTLVVATPTGQLHELGALLAAALAANLGWRVTYLGASLPAPEIAGAAAQDRARAVALSVVYPEDDPQLGAELTRLRESLPPEIALIVGGRALRAYRAALDRIGAFQADDLNEFGRVLDQLRDRAAPMKP